MTGSNGKDKNVMNKKMHILLAIVGLVLGFISCMLTYLCVQNMQVNEAGEMDRYEIGMIFLTLALDLAFVGYIVIVLKLRSAENFIKEFVNATVVTARIDVLKKDIKHIYGTERKLQDEGFNTHVSAMVATKDALGDKLDYAVELARTRGFLHNTSIDGI